MSNTRTNQKNSTAEICECLCMCLSACAAANEESKAKEAHNRHDHRDEQYHYEQAARIHHQMGDHYSEMQDKANAHTAKHEDRNESSCSIM